jgi:SM-20-related protein
MPVGANLACYNFAMYTNSDITANDEMILSNLAQYGFVIVDQYLPKQTITALANITKEKLYHQEMQHAGTGKQAKKIQDIRGDHIHWLDESSQEPSIQEYFRRMYQLKQTMNRQLYMGLATLETHLAMYPVGAFYQKHLDQFSVSGSYPANTRKVSSIVYLNDDWQPENGGQLRLYLNDGTQQDILPLGGRLVLFLSAEFWHEVLPANRQRLSLTGWFRTRELQPV